MLSCWYSDVLSLPVPSVYFLFFWGGGGGGGGWFQNDVGITLGCASLFVFNWIC